MEHMTVGDDEKKGYFLTPKGKTVGEETFVRMQILAAARVESPLNDSRDEQIVELLKEQNRLIEKGTTVNRKGFDSLKPVNHQSLAELVRTLPPLRLEKEDENWILAARVAEKTGETIENLKKQRQRGEHYPHEGLVYGCDTEGRIWCNVSKSRSFFYYTSFLSGHNFSR